MRQFVQSSVGKAFRKTTLRLKCETEVFQAGLEQHFGGLFFRVFLFKSVPIAAAIGREFLVQSNTA